MEQRHRIRRLVIRTIVVLVLGAIVNVAVAWGCAAAHRAGVPCEWNPHHNPRKDDPLVFFVIRRIGAEWVVGCGRPGTLLARHQDEVRTYVNTPWWPPEAVTFNDCDFAVATGWPRLTAASWRTVTASILSGDAGIEFASTFHRGVPIGDSECRDSGHLPAALPLSLIWPGFAINTIFYAAILWLLWATPFAIRRRRRIKRGRCGACGYDLRGTDHKVCPECGKAVASANGPSAGDAH